MGQRVNIQYSIDLKELPVEMEGLIAKAERKLAQCHNELQSLIMRYKRDVLMTTACTNDLSDLRENLTDIDFILEDTINLINGYVTYQLQKKDDYNEQEISEEKAEEFQKELMGTPSYDPEPSDELENHLFEEQLKEKISSFKNAMK
jgi:hypothetical protein